MTEPLLARLRDALTALTPQHPGAIEALRPLYDPAMRFKDPIQEVQGIESFLALNKRLVSRMRTLEWEIQTGRGDETEVFLEWIMRATPKLGPSVECHGVTRARARDGLIVDHRDYWDLGEVMASAVPGGIRVLHALRKPLA